MNAIEVRMECLKLAVQSGAPPDQVTVIAQALVGFLFGGEEAPAETKSGAGMGDPQNELTDREVLQATFNLLGALAERLTGARPTVRVRFPDGLTTGVYASAHSVTFDPILEQSTDRAPSAKGADTPLAPLQERSNGRP
jgi:hypothetical protein